MSCPDLKAYLLGELSEPEQLTIREHALTCSDCRLEMTRLRVTMSALRKVPDEEIPVRIRLVSDRVFEQSLWQRFFGFGGFSSRFAMALLVPTLLVTGALFGSRWRTQTTGGVSDAQIQRVVDARIQMQLGNMDAKVHDAVNQAVAEADRRNEIRTREMLASFQHRARADREGLVRAVESEYRWVDQKLNQVVYAANEKVPVLVQ